MGVTVGVSMGVAVDVLDDFRVASGYSNVDGEVGVVPGVPPYLNKNHTNPKTLKP